MSEKDFISIRENIPNQEGIMLCPVCGKEFIHPEGVDVSLGYHESYPFTLKFFCENGHRFMYKYDFKNYKTHITKIIGKW